MKKLFILLFFAVNIALGQNSVTISPTDADNTLIQKKGTAQMSIKGSLDGNNAGKSVLNLESTYQFTGSGTTQTATSTINFNSPAENKFSIKHSQYSSTNNLFQTTAYSWLSVNNGTSEIARFDDDAFVAKKIGINNYDPFYQFTFNSAFGDKLSLNGRTCTLSNPLGGGCSIYDDNHFGIGYQSNLFQIFSRDASGDIAFGYGKSSSMTERVRFKGNGNVGIGINPAAKFHVAGTESEKIRLENSTVLSTGVTNEILFKTGSYFTGAIKSIGTGSAFARMGFFTFTDASASNLVERLSINDGGNVGIGVTNPIAKLHVDGNIRSSTLAGTGFRNVYADANGTLVITSPQTSYYNIPSQSFRAEVSANSTTDISGRATLISGNSGWLEAPVQLPHGATVTSVKVYFMDNEASKGLDIKFFYKRMDGSLTGAIGQINYIGSSATELLQTIPVSGGVATIDNQNNWYHIGIRVLNDGAGESTWTNNLAVRGILISYTIPN